MSEQTKAAKILIIEDEALIAREIQHRLTNMGWEVVGMAFGREAIELAIETQPDLLLSDINLRHGLSGIDLALEIQEVVDVPVVFLTAYSDEETVARAKTVTPFGYIIKPVENRDLQITIEMALYKFRVEKELREKQQLLETALACIGSALVFVDDAGTVTNLNADAEEMLKAEFVPHTDWQTILSLESNDSVTPIIDNAFREKVVVKIPPFLMQRATDTTKLVDGIVGPMDAGAVLILRDLGDIDDPVEMLSAPDELISMRGEEHLSPSESAFCQLLISPENVSPQHLSAVVEEVRSLLDASLRATDLASVFAESMVSVSLPYTDINEGERIAEALLAQLAGFTFEREQISFSAGLAYSTAGDQEPIELFRRATTALDLARKSGGNRLWVLAEDKELGSSEIQGSHEYRHVILLWNTMNALANADDLASMCDQFCRHLFLAFHARCVALLGRSNGNLEVEIAYLEESGRTDSISDLHLTAAEFTALGSVLTGGSSSREVDGSIMVNVTDRWVLLMSGDSVETEDVQFLETLATYFAGSVSRFDVIEEPEPEVNLPQRALIYESREMQEVLDTADLAAPTDATVLLTGESGTGKELVAHYIHEHGGRKEKPLIVVDCGAVSPSLIESELFGHVKGAFTGATSNFAGRLKEANGATVLLDEIGELPIDTQVKFLRFVQDREIAPVGSSRYETVDARVIAATNKDLKEMVDQGRFREDLYYRLNVFSISVPPLRDRKSDIRKIAHHYLAVFSQRYGKQVTEFTAEAEEALFRHGWPGNARELSNVINRAVILSKDSRISAIQLGLFAGTELPVRPAESVEPLWRETIRTVVDIGCASDPWLPIGRYLEEDFIVASIARHDGVLNRAALVIGVPESTLRRKVQKIESLYGVGSPDRPEGWPTNPVFYEDVMRIAPAQKLLPSELLNSMLLGELQNRKLNKTLSARLMGVSVPTYRKLAEDFAEIF